MGPDVFGQYVGKDLESFWNRVKDDDPRLLPLGDLMEQADWKSKAIPYMLHGDGARYTNKNSDSLLSIQWQPYLCKNGFSAGIVPIFAVTKQARGTADGVESSDVCWRDAVHLLNGDFDGLHPMVDSRGEPWAPGTQEADWAGKPLCGGEYIMVPWVIAADLECLGNELKFNHFNSLNP